MSGIRRLLGLVTVAMAIETAVYSAITPLLPGFVETHGLSKATAGLLTAAYPIGTLVLSLPAAWLSARLGPKPTVVLALLALGLASLAFGLASSAELLVTARFLQGGAATAVWAGGLAWVVALAPRERRSEAIGTVIGAAIAGSLGGPAIGALADRVGTGIVFAVFFVAPLILAGALSRLPVPASVPGTGVAAVRAIAREPRLRRGMWLMALPAVAFGLFNVLVPLRLHDLGAGAVTIGAVFLLAVALESLMSPVAGRLADRRGAVWPARLGLLGGGAGLALLPVPGAVVPLALVLIVAASLLGLLWTPAMALVTEGAEARGIDPSFGFGLGNLAWGAGVALGGAAGGAVAGATADAVPYGALALVAVVTSAALRRDVAAPARQAATPTATGARVS